MYRILLFGEGEIQMRRMKDYVLLSGYEVQEGDWKQLQEYRYTIQKMDLILVTFEEIEIGYEKCVELRTMTNLPIIVLSSKGSEWDKIRLFQAGIDDFLTIPYLQSELMARIQNHIERYRRLTRPLGMIVIRDLKINAFTRQVYVSGQRISMRLKEFDILLYLAQHAGEILSREELYSKVWGEQESVVGCYNAVAVQVKRIRAKIEKDVQNPEYIETVWGVGYRFLD